MTENIDNTTAGGRLIFHVFGALAEFERELILERSGGDVGGAGARPDGRAADGDDPGQGHRGAADV